MGLAEPPALMKKTIGMMVRFCRGDRLTCGPAKACRFLHGAAFCATNLVASRHALQSSCGVLRSQLAASRARMPLLAWVQGLKGVPGLRIDSGGGFGGGRGGGGGRGQQQAPPQQAQQAQQQRQPAVTRAPSNGSFANGGGPSEGPGQGGSGGRSNRRRGGGRGGRGGGGSGGRGRGNGGGPPPGFY